MDSDVDYLSNCASLCRVKFLRNFVGTRAETSKNLVSQRVALLRF